MSTLKPSPLPTFVSKTVKISAVVGVLLGASISFLNKNDFVSAIIIMGVMGLVFAWLSRWLAVTFLRAWLETKIEQYKKQQEEENKLLAAKAAQKADSAKKEEAKKK
jgi:small-conductance mechanosensitive channel